MLNIFSYFRNAPDFEVWHSHPHLKSKVLITAGIDGDEYAGIQAARQLIKTYDGHTPITVIPVVNILGNNMGVSHNPLDGKLLKYLYPGSPFGSSSSKLVYRLYSYLPSCQLWIDLHSGATDEHLFPFIWAPSSYPVLSHLQGRTLVESTFQKDKLPYIMLESGELGLSTQAMVNPHLTWLSEILNNLDKPAKINWQPTYTSLKIEKFEGQQITKDTLWYSSKAIAFGYQ